MGDLYALSNQGDATRNCACQQKSMIYTVNLWETKTFKKKEDSTGYSGAKNAR